MEEKKEMDSEQLDMQNDPTEENDGKKKILVVDDEIVLNKIITTRLRKLGYNSFSVNSGEKALEFIDNDPPDLIILDLLMPGMDGYEVAQAIRGNSKISHIPIIMLTAKVSQETKIKALKLGIDDYMTKPYDAEELAARIQSVLRRAQIVTTSESGGGEGKALAIDSRDKKRLDFLKKMIDEDVVEIQPTYNMLVKSGYEYRQVTEFFDIQPGMELQELYYLEEKGTLKRNFFDKILICPNCTHHNISLREVCPTDRSPDIALMPTIHHYKCGYIGTEREFMHGLSLVCPKCMDELEAIGVDYDKPGKMFVCNKNQHKFTEPDVLCQCRNCKNEFYAGDALRSNIYSFVITDKASEAVQQGRFFAVNFEQELMDQDINLYNLNYFRTKFREELRRAEQFERPLSLVLLEVVGLDDFIEQGGEEMAHDILRDLTAILKESLWKVDIPARYDKNSFVSILPEADSKRAKSVVDGIMKKAQSRIKAALTLDIKFVTYPEDGTTEDLLLERLVKQTDVIEF